MKFFKFNMDIYSPVVGFILLALSLLMNNVQAAQATNQPFEKALESFYLDDLNAAVIHLKNALKNNPKHLPSRILMAEILIAQGNGAGAEVELDFAEQGQADNKKILPLRLEAYLLQSKYEQVINKATPILGNSKLSSKILVFKGRALFGRNNVSLALVEYKKALDFNPNNEQALLGIAQVEIKQRKYEQALEHLTQTLQLDPLNTNAMQMQAGIYQLKGDIERAVITISGAININAKHFPALLTRAGIYIEQQKFQLALIDLEKILADIPNEPRANYLKAVSTSALGMNEELEKTASHLDIVLTGIPDDIMRENPIYYYLAGLVNYNQGEYIKAQDDLRDYIDIINDDVRALKLIAKVDLLLGEVFSAKNYLVKARLIAPDDVDLWKMLGDAYFATGDIEKAQRYYQDVINARPNSAAAHSDLGSLTLAIGKTPEGVASFQKANALAPENTQISFKLAQAYSQAKQPKKALQLIDRLLVKHANDSYLHQQRAILLGSLGQHAEAENSFLQALNLDDSNLDAVIHLARIDVIKKQVSEARQRLQSYLKKYPNDPRLLVELGDTYSKNSEINDAQKYYEKSYSLNRESSLSVNKVLDIYEVKKEHTKAIETATSYLNRINNDAGLHLRLAKFYMAVKDYPKAVESYLLAIKNSNDKASVLHKFAQSQVIMQNREGAISSLQKSIAWNEYFIPSYLKLIELFTSINDQEKAFSTIELLKLKIDMPALIHILQADVYIAGEDFPAAEKLYKESLALDNSQRASLGLANAFRLQGKHSEAVAFLEKRHKQQLGNAAIAVALADAYVDSGDAKTAAIVYDKQIERNGQLPILLNNAAIVNLSLDNLSLALEYATLAYRSVPNSVAIMDTVAWVYTKSNQPDKALPIFREALAIESDNAEIQYHLAVSLMMLERKSEAVRYLNRALNSEQDFTGSEDAKTLLASLKINN